MSNSELSQLLDESMLKDIINFSYQPYDIYELREETHKIFNLNLSPMIKRKCFRYLFNKHLFWDRKGNKDYSYNYVLNKFRDVKNYIPRQVVVELLDTRLDSELLWEWFHLNYGF